MPSSEVTVEVGSRTFKLTNLEKVLYPDTGFTKASVIDYYVRVAPVMLDHIGDRGITMRRFPDGVEAESFFNKRRPDWRPEWLRAVRGPGQSDGPIDYCRLDEVASIAWAANLAALEIHAPMARAGDIDTPTMLVYDLDPGEGTGMAQCCQVAQSLTEVLDAVGLQSWPKTSGSKGLQLYVPLNTPHTHQQVSAFAKATGQLLERDRPGEITTTMGASNRIGKVLIDWSQNSRHKTTIAPYSLRAKPTPTASTPVTWDEVDAGADGTPLPFEAGDVLDRVDEHGDLFAPTVTVEQVLPGAG